MIPLAGLALRNRRDDGKLADHGPASVCGRLLARLGRLSDAPPPLGDAERFAEHLATEFAAVFAFLWDPSVEATNWRAEQAIRPAVVTRKVCGGNRARPRSRCPADTGQRRSQGLTFSRPVPRRSCFARRLPDMATLRLPRLRFRVGPR